MIYNKTLCVFSDEESQNVVPNNTIMLRGLAQHLTENDIRQDIHNCALVTKDIRLIRKKETGKVERI